MYKNFFELNRASVRLCHQLTAVCRRPDSSSTPFSLGPSSPRTRTGPLASCHGLWPLARPKPRTPLPLPHSRSATPHSLPSHSTHVPVPLLYPTTTAGPGTPRARTTPRYENPRPCPQLAFAVTCAQEPAPPLTPLLLQRPSKPSPRRFHDPRPLAMSRIVRGAFTAFLFLTTR